MLLVPALLHAAAHPGAVPIHGTRWRTARRRARIGAMPQDAAVTVTEGVPATHRAAVADLYHEAFARKLMPLLGRPIAVRRLIAECLRPDLVMGAWSGGELAGVLGLQEPGGARYLPVEAAAARRHLGRVRGTIAWLVFTLMDADEVAAGEVRVAAIAVAPSMRGRGVGTALLGAAEARARRHGALTLRLEVVDTNGDARRLYERLGFTATATRRYPLPRRWLGFSGVTEMERPVSPTP